MAKKKQRKGKSAPKAAPRRRVSAAKPQAAKTASAVKGPQFPVQAHVLKGGDRIPVAVVDQAHLDRLNSEHGEAAVEVGK